jgi:MFS family permease
MAASIFLYSFRPSARRMRPRWAMFIFFRSTTFIGVCVEFVAAITWLAEVFPRQEAEREMAGHHAGLCLAGWVLVTA